DHPAIAVELAFINALAADKGEIDRPWIVRQRRGDRPADAAAVPLSIGEAVPVDARRLEMTDQHARRPIRFRRDRRGRLCDDPPERIILGNLPRQHTPAGRLHSPGPLPPGLRTAAESRGSRCSDRDRRTRRPADKGRAAPASRWLKLEPSRPTPAKPP